MKTIKSTAPLWVSVFILGLLSITTPAYAQTDSKGTVQFLDGPTGNILAQTSFDFAGANTLTVDSPIAYSATVSSYGEIIVIANNGTRLAFPHYAQGGGGVTTVALERAKTLGGQVVFSHVSSGTIFDQVVAVPASPMRATNEFPFRTDSGWNTGWAVANDSSVSRTIFIQLTNQQSVIVGYRTEVLPPFGTYKQNISDNDRLFTFVNGATAIPSRGYVDIVGGSAVTALQFLTSGTFLDMYASVPTDAKLKLLVPGEKFVDMLNRGTGRLPDDRSQLPGVSGVQYSMSCSNFGGGLVSDSTGILLLPAGIVPLSGSCTTTATKSGFVTTKQSVTYPAAPVVKELVDSNFFNASLREQIWRGHNTILPDFTQAWNIYLDTGNISIDESIPNPAVGSIAEKVFTIRNWAKYDLPQSGITAGTAPLGGTARYSETVNPAAPGTAYTLVFRADATVASGATFQQFFGSGGLVNALLIRFRPDATAESLAAVFGALTNDGANVADGALKSTYGATYADTINVTGAPTAFTVTGLDRLDTKVKQELPSANIINGQFSEAAR